MARIPYKIFRGKLTISAALLTLLGSGAYLAVENITEFEGYVPEAYQDPVGIWTKCWGDTTNVTPGMKYTEEQCVKSLNDHVLELAKPLFKCVPDLKNQPDEVKAAFTSMAYNIGSGAFCKSSVAKYANSGNWERACTRMREIYKTAKGKQLPGLVTRRNKESELCLSGLRKVGKDGQD